MKNILILILIPFISFAQQDVPEKYWIDDSNFEDKINSNNAFGDDETKPIVVEFWAKFNEANCFAEWETIKNAVYYRVDISKAPEAKKKYRVRMAPTLIIFKDGIKETVFKAGLDLMLPADLNDIQEAINEINNASKF
jgi:thiol-disulfide isomerase/thioredoxin